MERNVRVTRAPQRRRMMCRGGQFLGVGPFLRTALLTPCDPGKHTNTARPVAPWVGCQRGGDWRPGSRHVGGGPTQPLAQPGASAHRPLVLSQTVDGGVDAATSPTKSDYALPSPGKGSQILQRCKPTCVGVSLARFPDENPVRL